MLELALILFFPFFMAFAGSQDLVSMTISNKISVALMIGFMICAIGIGMPWEQIAWHWAMFGIVLTVTFIMFATGTLGGGDAKLVPCTALWFGWEHTAMYLLVASLIGGVLTLGLMRFRASPIPDSIHNIDWIAHLYRADTGVPYGIALGAGAILVYPQTPWMQYVFDAAAAL